MNQREGGRAIHKKVPLPLSAFTAQPHVAATELLEATWYHNKNARPTQLRYSILNNHAEPDQECIKLLLFEHALQVVARV